MTDLEIVCTLHSDGHCLVSIWSRKNKKLNSVTRHTEIITLYANIDREKKEVADFLIFAGRLSHDLHLFLLLAERYKSKKIFLGGGMQKTQLKRPVVDIFCCCLFDFKSRESVDHRFMPDKNIGTVYFMLFIFYFLKIFLFSNY